MITGRQEASAETGAALRDRRLDGHVHVVGNGSGGSGCWYRPRGVTRFGAPFMVRGVGLRPADLRGDLEGRYVERLREMIRTSSLEGAVILAQDDPYTERGEKIANRASFYVPNDYVLGLARRHPEFLPAVSIHPARADAHEELERCLPAGAVMLKCLPNCQNIDWNLPRYTRFLERMAEAGLVLLAHTGSERTLPVLAPELATPAVLTRPLEIGVTCIAAHCGTGLWWLDPDYFDLFVAMTRKHPLLYGDNSALASCNFRARPSALRRLASEELRGRIVHGSDVPVPVTGVLAWAGGVLGWRAWRRTAAIANPIERDAELKRALGFGPESFTLLSRLIRRRLVEGQAPR